MAASITIESIKLNNLSIYKYMNKIKYDTNKADSSGEKCTFKHLYEHLIDPFFYSLTSLGICMCINCTKYTEDENIFYRNPDKNEKLTSLRYCTQLCHILKFHHNAVI